MLLEAGGVCTTIGHDLVQYEIQVEHIIQQLDTITKTELPAIVKQRRGLDQLVLELDTAKARLAAAKLEAEQAGVISGGGKVEKCGEELDDAENEAFLNWRRNLAKIQGGGQTFESEQGHLFWLSLPKLRGVGKWQRE